MQGTIKSLMITVLCLSRILSTFRYTPTTTLGIAFTASAFYNIRKASCFRAHKCGGAQLARLEALSDSSYARVFFGNCEQPSIKSEFLGSIIVEDMSVNDIWKSLIQHHDHETRSAERQSL